MQRHRIAYVPTLKLSLCSFEIHGAKIKNDPPSPRYLGKSEENIPVTRHAFFSLIFPLKFKLKLKLMLK